MILLHAVCFICSFVCILFHSSTQQSIYDEVVRPLVSSVLEGFNCCVFAYGQTGWFQSAFNCLMDVFFFFGFMFVICVKRDQSDTQLSLNDKSVCAVIEIPSNY